MPWSLNPREAHFGKSSPHTTIKNLFTIYIQIHLHVSMPTLLHGCIHVAAVYKLKLLDIRIKCVDVVIHDFCAEGERFILLDQTPRDGLYRGFMGGGLNINKPG
jgi:hypothetical protein